MRAVALDASVAFAPSAKRSPPEEETLLAAEAHPSMLVVLDAAAALGPSLAVLGPSAVQGVAVLGAAVVLSSSVSPPLDVLAGLLAVLLADLLEVLLATLVAALAVLIAALALS